MNRWVKIIAAVLLSAGPLVAQVQLPALLSDGMVVQRDVPTHFWGMAKPGEKISATFRGEERTTLADRLGHWNMYFSPKGAGGPFEATVGSTNTIVIHDILVGDVWVASGQSNMEFPLRRAQDGDAESAIANFPSIRILKVKTTSSNVPQEDITTTGWKACTPASIQEFSAVAYFFARDIQTREKVPIGIIGSYWGGTPADAWTSMEALAADPVLEAVFASYARYMAEQPDIPRIVKAEQDEAEQMRSKGMTPPEPPWRPDPRMWQPAALFNGMIAPLTPFPIRGVIWYQGETNSMLWRKPQIYGHLFETMIRDWRRRWAVGDFPFLYVQISDFLSTAEEDWPAIREGQRQALALRNTGMAVSIDIGDPHDVHPLNKRDIGLRLALLARTNVYNEEVESSGPALREVTRDSGGLRLWFDHTRGGLAAHGAPMRGFELAGADEVFHQADARIDGNSVLVSSTVVTDPVSVRYGWANSPKCDLFNGAGLPASPFTATLTPLH